MIENKQEVKEIIDNLKELTLSDGVDDNNLVLFVDAYNKTLYLLKNLVTLTDLYCIQSYRKLMFKIIVAYTKQENKTLKQYLYEKLDVLNDISTYIVDNYECKDLKIIYIK